MADSAKTSTMSFSKTTFGTDSKGSGGGEWGGEASLTFIFYDELMRYYKKNQKIVEYDGGIITEVLGKGKYKVKLQFKGSVVTARSTEASFTFSSRSYLKGAYCLIIIESETQYLILAVRQTGAFTPAKASEYAV